MKVEVYDAYNPDAIEKINPSEYLFESLKKVDSILKFLSEIQPEISPQYIPALKKRLTIFVDDFPLKVFPLGKDVIDRLAFLKEYPELRTLIMQFTCLYLKITEDERLQLDEVEVTSYDYMMALRRLPYHTLKAFTDILGEEETKTLWDSILNKQYEEHRAMAKRFKEEMKKEGKNGPTPDEQRTHQIKGWCDFGIGDFTMGLFDEHKYLYRFDSCLTHEVMKDLNDPDWAYLSSCYVTDHPGFNTVSSRCLRRTQTLHHADFCDELYWYPDVHTDPEQPSLEFTRKLGNSEAK
ncbi:MAG: hypothetical protein RTU30_15470 [Candidatus Thorarchaeota archaeon]